MTKQIPCPLESGTFPISLERVLRLRRLSLLLLLPEFY